MPTRDENREKALEKKKELLQRFLNKRPNAKVIESPVVPDKSAEVGDERKTDASVFSEAYGSAGVAAYRDGEAQSSAPSPALIKLVDLYLLAAREKTKSIVLMWPATPRSLAVVHILATLERWARGNKQGVRGLIFPVKTNAFHPLNHLHLDRASLIAHAQRLIESPGTKNPDVTKGCPAKDAFLFSMASLKPEEKEMFNPTMGELIPHFFGGASFTRWESCSGQLLTHIGAKLARRQHKKALAANREEIGAPSSAPDAFFALDGRMSQDEIRKALLDLKRVGAPEVILVNATKPVRQAARGWASRIAKFSALIEEVFSASVPGLLLVVDDPHAAFVLRKELKERSNHRNSGGESNKKQDYWIKPIVNGTREDGLLPPGVERFEVPVPREFDVELVDSQAAATINKLYRIATHVPGGRESAQPVLDAAAFLSRLAALPCGVSTLVDWLEGTGVSEQSRRTYSWSTYYAALAAFAYLADAGVERGSIEECLKLGTQLYENYERGTPFALRLAELVGRSSHQHSRRTVVVFTSAIYRRLAERFLSQYSDYPNGATFKEFALNVTLIPSAQFQENLETLDGSFLVIAGLDDEGLRLLMMDNRVPKHTVVLLTQRAGRYLKSVLSSLTESFDEFRQLKPRMESILRQLQSLSSDQVLLARGDFTLPIFQLENTASEASSNEDIDPEAWSVVLDNGHTMYRRPTHRVYVYDPSSVESTDRGFRRREVKWLEPGDKVFVMSPDLRELVEGVLKEAGVPIDHDKTFEGALREYHQSVIKRLNSRFQGGSLTEKVRQLRVDILAKNESMSDEFPAVQSVRHWIDLGASADTPFDQLKPQAPMRKAHFDAFGESLEFSKLELAFYWQRVIMPVRNARRLDGRHVSDVYTDMLLSPESAMVHSKISRQTIKLLFRLARESVSAVEKVSPPLLGAENG